jgi:hypothetical protein
MEREDVLTCLLSSVHELPGVTFSKISQCDVRRILEIFDNIGGKGATSGLVNGETGFGLLLVEGLVSAACGNSKSPLQGMQSESKEELLPVEESKTNPDSVPEFIVELIDRFGVAQYCKKMAEHGTLSNFELNRTATRVYDLISCQGVSSPQASSRKNMVIEELLESLRNDASFSSEGQRTVEGMDEQITRSMQLGYRFALLFAQASGVSAHHFF